MKRTYWEKIAPSYNEEIFDVLENDKKGLISKVIKKKASKTKTAIDIGCAIGKWLPLLSPLFKKVIALDISEKNLKIAREHYPQLKNIIYQRADMSGKKSDPPKADFGICINALLTPDQNDRDVFFKGIAASIKKGGYVVITIPSLESWLLSSIVQQKWKIDKTLYPKEKNGKKALEKWNNIRQGNTEIDEIPHKHYLKEELILLLAEVGFEAEDFQKIEYTWNTEFLKPPKWLREPKPWDWMVVAKRV
jgi:2-polyprenyl-3-methyl-5-hydroxy-6-metoxy-1,4-benzoquinol methylase